MAEQSALCPHCAGVGSIMVPVPASWTSVPPEIFGTASARCPACQGSGLQRPRYLVAHALPQDRGALECWTDTLENACALAQALAHTYGGSTQIMDAGGHTVNCTDLLPCAPTADAPEPEQP